MRSRTCSVPLVANHAAVKVHRGEWTQPEFAAIADALQQTTGLVFPPNRRESAETGMRRAMSAACVSDPNDLLRAVIAAGEIRDILITELTVGETFFLREQGQFDFLRETVLPALRTTVPPRPLRIWSAGCATGEEPYSLAMTLKEAAWPGPVSILGTDLAFARLVAAKRARYTAWSMRGVSAPVIERYFERVGKQFVLRADVSKSVEFRVLNLASGEYPSLVSGVEQMDVIFCRNVLIYFDLQTVAEIASRLIASLAPDGWLFLGASDPPIAEFIPCEVVLTGAGLAYRRPNSRAGAAGETFSHVESWPASTTLAAAWDLAAATDFATTLEFAVVEPADTTASLTATVAGELPSSTPVSIADDALLVDISGGAYDQGRYDAAIELARAAIVRGDDTEASQVVLVRSLANRGALEDAETACVKALARFGLSAELTHLHAVVLAEAGRYAEAGVAAKQALYLDPHYIVAHLALGDASSRAGNLADARRAFRNAETLLQGFAPDTPIPGGDGAEAAQLLRIARFRLETTRAAVARKSS